MRDTQKDSKFLSYVLRHHPEKLDLTLTKDGWAETKDILEKVPLTMEELEYIVETNNKKRFAFNEDKSRIRANQGHSVKVDLKYKTEVPPVILYHGTVSKFLDAIFKKGLLKMNRHHVHLSADVDTATNVASRRGKPTVLRIDAKAMFADGYKFFKSENGVWLTEEVPTKYIYI